MTLSVLIAEDEALARRRLRRLLSREDGVEIVAESRNGREAVAAIEACAPDLVFLDVQMPELDGFGVLEALQPDRIPAIVFVTAYDQYAVRAFEVHALDYLLKPFSESRFRGAFRRARALLAEPNAADDSARHTARILALLKQLTRDAAHTGDAYLRRILVRSNGRIMFVRAADVHWLEAAGNYVKLHLGGETVLVRTALTALTDRLDPGTFVRIHRSTVVNLDRVREIQPWFSGDSILILQDGVKLRVSRNYRDEMERKMGSD